MAFDTQEERMSVVGVGRPWMRSRYPTNDVASGTVTDFNSFPFDTMTDDNALFQTDGVTDVTDTLFIDSIETTNPWSTLSETVLISELGFGGSPQIGDPYNITRANHIGVKQRPAIGLSYGANRFAAPPDEDPDAAYIHRLFERGRMTRANKI